MLNDIVLSLAIYVICWWVVLFCVLPIGTVGEQHEIPTDGSQWGAPANPNMKRKFITTTWVAAIVWIVVMIIVWTGIMPLPRLPAV